jgi:hypothetical protein
MPDDLIVEPVTKFVFVNELNNKVAVHIISRFYIGESQFNISLSANRVTEYTVIPSTTLIERNLHICPQSRSQLASDIQDRYDHKCRHVTDEISVRFERIKCLVRQDVALVIITECADVKSPASLRQLCIWNCIVYRISSSTIFEHIGQHYSVLRE